MDTAWRDEMLAKMEPYKKIIPYGQGQEPLADMLRQRLGEAGISDWSLRADWGRVRAAHVIQPS